jgi:hypothetical protein
MAITQVGSALAFAPSGAGNNTGTVSSTITVPATTEIVIAGVSGYQGTSAGFEAMTFTKSGVDTAMTRVPGADASAGQWQGAMFYLVGPDIGSNKTMKWDWVGTGGSGAGAMLHSVTFWTGINTSDAVRDSDAAQGTSLTLSTPTLTAQSGDKIVAWAAYYYDPGDGGGSVDTWSNLTEIADVTENQYAEGAWAYADPSGNTTVGLSAVTGTEYSISAVVLKAAGGAATKAPPIFHRSVRFR